ncbi:hypothetical protein ZYGR_0A02920 [Zygosaccharomyces rouxii]|uniref:Metallothionein n=1 Tax=Zygosaccharomyces rouxii TaxID=4956 RepID=A0A1Q2ZTL7_ZYGRO|nr:hypothetical protein ZYGR_0A02920 [Zygosaccharomyces rouxii]
MIVEIRDYVCKMCKGSCRCTGDKCCQNCTECESCKCKTHAKVHCESCGAKCACTSDKNCGCLD